jgi:predicted GNAT family acetyltransferase
MAGRSDVEVTNNAAEHRLEARVDGHLAIAEYNLIKDGVIFTHTEVPKELEGRGIGGALIRSGLAWARQENRKVMPQCPFFAAYMKKHAETHDLVHPSFRSALGI